MNDALLLLVCYVLAFIGTWLGIGMLLGVSTVVIWLTSMIPGRLGRSLRCDPGRGWGILLVAMSLTVGFAIGLVSGCLGRFLQYIGVLA
jgi:hypothetical protein